MFKKLHKRMLLLNLAVLTILLLVVFGSLYLTTYTNIQARIDEDIRKLNDFHFITELPPGFTEEPNMDEFNPSRTIAFIVIIDDTNIIVESYSQFETDDDFFFAAIANAVDESGKFVLEDSIWAYEKTSDFQGTKIVFLDITAEEEILSALVFRFVGIFALAFIAVYALSNFITKKSIAPIKESFEKQKRFISDASHELKTPLAVMNTNIDVLLSKDNNKDDVKWLSYIKNEINRMDSLTKDLLYLAKATEGIEKTEQTDVNISEKVEGIVLSIEPLAYQQEISISAEITPNLYVTFDEQNLHQVILILLENAIKYNIPGGDIYVNVYKKGTHTYLDITNSGEGISEEDLPYIFDRFYKADKSRKHTQNSYGLGLSIAKAIMERNNGSISVISDESLTTFTLKIK